MTRPMKVLFAIDSLHGGGAETSLIDMLPALRDRGIEPALVTLLADDNALTARIGDVGVDVARVRSRSWPGRIAELRRTLSRQAPDVLHTSLTWSDFFGRLAAVGVDVPVVTTLVNASYGAEHRRHSKYGAGGVLAVHALDLLASRRTTRFHAISADVGAVMTRRLRLRPERITVVYRGRDAVRLGRRTPARGDAVRRSLGIPPQAPLVLVVGRLDKQKAVDVSLRAVGMLNGTFSDLHTLVVGRDGNDAAHVRGMAAPMTNVRLLGHRVDVAELMCAADCLAFPSRWEGMGGTLVEALALELPLVATDIGPVREVLGDVGWPLIPVNDAPALAAGLARVLNGELPLAEIISRGRQRFESSFTIDHAADGMVDLYERAIAEVRR